MGRPLRLYESYTGVEAEADAIDEVSPKGQYDGNYLKYRDSLRRVAQNQPENWDPEQPPTQPTNLPSNLHYFVEDFIHSNKEFEDATIRFYTARGSHLDKLHGVDAFFTATLPNKQTVWVTVDFTTNERKAQIGHKADYIIYFSKQFFEKEFTSTEEQEAQEQEWANEISDLLAERLKHAQTLKQTA